MAYERKQYSVAVEMLEDEFNSSDSKRVRSRNAYLLGRSYSYLENTQMAVKWLETATTLEYGNEAMLYLAQAYKKEGYYAESLATYEKLKPSVTDKRAIDREIFILKEIASWSSTVDRSYIVKAAPTNSDGSDYSPFLYNNLFIVFTSDRTDATGSEVYNWTGQKHTDLFMMPVSGTDVRKFDGIINSPANEGTAVFSKNGEEIFFTRCDSEGEVDAFCKIMYSNSESGIWSPPVALPFCKEGINYGQPCLIENDSVLIFSAYQEEGFGGNDLYYSVRYIEDDQLKWSDPLIMPQTINSSGNEMFPTSTPGDTLYYSSDYFPGLGGLDIFMTYLKPDGSWAPPKNLKSPINSSYDDFAYIMIDEDRNERDHYTQKGMFTSTRNTSSKEDLFFFERRDVIKENSEPEIAAEDSIEINYEYYLAGIARTNTFINPEDPNSGIEGKKPLLETKITLENGKEFQELTQDADGRFYAQLLEGETYIIRGAKKGYLSDQEAISVKRNDVKSNATSKTYNVELILDKIYQDVEIVLEDIYYDFNRWEIRNDAKPSLDSLFNLMVNNPQIKIQLSSHTDCRGDDEYNQILSQKRAESAVTYLLNKGIKSQRLIPIGYGETQPAIVCDCESCTEIEHQKNRRTTFKITEY